MTMKDIGIRHLKAHASDIVRRVQEEHTSYTITRHGRTVGILAPADYTPPADKTAGDTAWDGVFEAIKDMRKRRRSGNKSALQELSKMRR
jgi:prevent-host-death family protein